MHQEGLCSVQEFDECVENLKPFNIGCQREPLCSSQQTQARTQPFSKGGSIACVSQTMTAVLLWALAHSLPRGSGGILPQKIFKLD